jgi:hypothetical protein
MRDVLIPWTPATATASVREEDNTLCTRRDLKVPLQGNPGHGNPYQLVLLFERALHVLQSPFIIISQPSGTGNEVPAYGHWTFNPFRRIFVHPGEISCLP